MASNWNCRPQRSGMSASPSELHKTRRTKKNLKGTLIVYLTERLLQGPGPDKRESVGVEGGRESRNSAWSSIYRRGSHAGHRVLLLPQPGPGGRYGAHSSHGHKQVRQSVV